MDALPPLRLLSVFEAVVRCRGMTAAAREFNVSPAAISQAVRQLESHVGVALLDRRTRPPAVTPPGLQLHDACASGLGTIRDCIDEIRSDAAAAERSVTIACSVGTATHWLMPRLPDFHRARSDVAVNVMTTASGEPAFAAGVDIAIRYGSGAWGDGASRLLFAEVITPVCSPEFAWRIRDIADPLGSVPLIHVDERSWIGWREYLKRTRGGDPKGNPALRFTNYVQATQAALAGQGVMLGWRAVTGDLVRDGRLVTVGGPSLSPEDAHHVVTPHRGGKTAAVDAVARWLVEAGRGDGASLAVRNPAAAEGTCVVDEVGPGHNLGVAGAPGALDAAAPQRRHGAPDRGPTP